MQLCVVIMLPFIAHPPTWCINVTRRTELNAHRPALLWLFNCCQLLADCIATASAGFATHKGLTPSSNHQHTVLPCDRSLEKLAICCTLASPTLTSSSHTTLLAAAAAAAACRGAQYSLNSAIMPSRRSRLVSSAVLTLFRRSSARRWLSVMLKLSWPAARADSTSSTSSLCLRISWLRRVCRLTAAWYRSAAREGRQGRVGKAGGAAGQQGV